MPIPIKSKIKIFFKKAKEVRCLKNNIIVDISTITDFEFDKENSEWTSIGGSLLFWSNNQFAEIIKLKPNVKCKCQSCNCDEKKKIDKRKNNKLI